MKTLYILRHAQALSTEAGGTDKNRKLSPQGKADARALGETMLRQDMRPDLVLCSAATRTRETLGCVLESLENAKTEYLENLYNAEAQAYMHEFLDVPDSVETLMLVGHNPGIHQLAAQLTADDASHHKAALIGRLMGGYAPATLSVLECDVENWADVKPYENRLMAVLETTEYNGPERPTRWM